MQIIYLSRKIGIFCVGGNFDKNSYTARISHSVVILCEIVCLSNLRRTAEFACYSPSVRPSMATRR